MTRPHSDSTRSRPGDPALRALVDVVSGIPAIVAVHEGPDHVYVHSNRAYQAAVGHRPVIGVALRDAIPELEGQGIFERFDEVYRSGRPSKIERLPARVRVGKRMRMGWYTQTLQPWFGSDGGIRGVWSLAFDTTDAVRAELASSESRKRFAAVFEQAAVGIALLSSDGRWLEVNDRLCAMLGHARDELRELTWADVTHPDDRAEDRALARRLMAGEIGEYSTEKRFLRRDRSILEATLAISAVSSDELVVVIEDIGERKQAARDLALLAEAGAVLASTLDYEATLANVARLATRWLADCCIVDLVEDGEVRRLRAVHADPTKGELVEALEQMVLDREKPHLVWSVLETRRPQLVSNVTPAYIEGLAQNPGHVGVLRELAPTSLLGVPLLTRGRLLGALLLIRSDPSRPYGPAEMQLAEELANRAALAIQNANLYASAQRAIGERRKLLSVVAHDLRDPLNAATLASQLMLAKIPDGDGFRPLRELAGSAQRAVRHADRLIRDLMEAARIDSGQLAMEPHRVPPAEVIREAAALLAPLIQASSLELEAEAREDLPDVCIARDRILQVLSNLVGNAVKFTPPGGRIRIFAEFVPPNVRFSVADTGAGIPADEVPRVFEAFRKSQPGDRRGLGLGLSICKAIVEHYGGTIRVESDVGRGTTIHFTVPVAPEAGPCSRGGAV